MERYTLEQRVIILKTHYKYGEYYAETVRKLRAIFGRDNAPKDTTVRRLVIKFEESGSVGDIKTPVRCRTSRSAENIAAVRESVAENPGTSIRHRSQQIDIPRSSLHRILTKYLNLHPYKIQLTQELKPADHALRRVFVNWVLQSQQVDSEFSNKIKLTPCDFFLWGFVKSRAYANNPITIHELKDKIRRIIGEIEQQICENVIENFIKRARVCQQSRGGAFGRHFIPYLIGRCVLYAEIKI